MLLPQCSIQSMGIAESVKLVVNSLSFGLWFIMFHLRFFRMDALLVNFSLHAANVSISKLNHQIPTLTVEALGFGVI